MQLYRFIRKIEVLVPAETDTTAAESEEELMGKVRYAISEGCKNKKNPVFSAALSGQGKSHMLPITGDTAALMDRRSFADLFNAKTKAKAKTKRKAATKRSGKKA